MALFFFVVLSALAAPTLPDHPRGPQIRARLQTVGIGLWVVYKNRETKAIFQMADEIGATNILPRYAGRNRSMSPEQLQQFANQAKKHHLFVTPWIYAYPDTEKQWIDEIYKALGGHPAFAGVMINIEQRRSVKENKALAETIARWQKAYPDVLVGYTGYNLAITHQYTGIRQLIRLADYWSPQVYWSHNGSSPREFLLRGYAQWYQLGQDLGFDPVIVPVGQAYWSDPTIRKPIRRNSGEFLEFVKNTAGYTQISWYSYDDLSLRKNSWAVAEIAEANRFRNPATRTELLQAKEKAKSARFGIVVIGVMGLWLAGAILVVIKNDRRLAWRAVSWPFRYLYRFLAYVSKPFRRPKAEP